MNAPRGSALPGRLFGDECALLLLLLPLLLLNPFGDWKGSDKGELVTDGRRWRAALSESLYKFGREPRRSSCSSRLGAARSPPMD